MSPTGRHDTEALDYHFENGDFTHLKRWVVGFRALLKKGELDDRCDRHTIEGKRMSFELGTMGERALRRAGSLTRAEAGRYPQNPGVAPASFGL